MTREQTVDAAAQAITDAILAIPEVRGLFPHSVVAAAVGVLIGAPSTPTSSLVEIDRTAKRITVSARLAIDAAASSAAVAVGARAAVDRVLGTSIVVALHIQIAHID